MVVLLTILTFLMHPLMATEGSPVEMTVYRAEDNGTKERSFSLTQHNKVFFDKECVQKIVSSGLCKAWEVFQKSKSVAKKKKIFKGEQLQKEERVSPAVNYCQTNGGKSLTTYKANRDQFVLCLFDDGSLIDAWALYEGGPIQKVSL